jgi:DNA-binding response OmpR family regulator
MHRILIIDPESSIRLAVKIGLSPGVFEVDGAEDGFEGLGLSNLRFYDIIIVSLNLPDMDGYEVVSTIHSHSPDTIVIAVTERTVKEEILAGVQYGVSVYLEKPLDMKSIEDAITEGLRNQASIKNAPGEWHRHTPRNV